MTVSFELFPVAEGARTIRLATELMAANPDHISLTYGAAGSDRERSIDQVSQMCSAGLPITAHLTAAGQNSHSLSGSVDAWQDAGLKSVLILRGDGAGPGESFEPHPLGFTDSLSLIKFAKKQGFKDIAVAAYPDPHSESRGVQADLNFLQEKQQAGANRAVTQFFFDVEPLLRLRDGMAKQGVELDLIPGVMPLFAPEKVFGFSKRCGVVIPDQLRELVESTPRETLAVTVATEIMCQLRAEGFEHIHIYSMNNINVSLRLAGIWEALRPVTLAA